MVDLLPIEIISVGDFTVLAIVSEKYVMIYHYFSFHTVNYYLGGGTVQFTQR